MTGIYYTDMLDVLIAAGCSVSENGTTNGWQTRARSSGGFPAAPLCVFWHHTASQTSPANDLSWMIDGCDDAPVGNMLIDRAGVCWPIAAGASNCAGKGGPMTFSRGTCPVDQGNTRGWQIEVANSGVGNEPWTQAQVDAFFRASNAMNARFGNLPSDITSHALGSGNGYTSRKIDPAPASVVQGPWRPRSTNSSGTWDLDDMRAECNNRAAVAPTPPPQEDDDMTPEQAAQLTDIQNQCQEFRRLFGVLFGGAPPGNETEAEALRALWSEGETPAETRRMVGVMLGWSPPAKDTPEPAALERLWS